jgi:hypothetical protein
MNEKIARFLEEQQPETPCLVVDLDTVAEAYRLLRHYLPLARVFYAVKANPAPEIVTMLNGVGSSFDVASRGEVDLCIGHGVAPERISFGNTIKKERDVAYAYERGVRLFAFDSAAELDKLARSAPGAARAIFSTSASQSTAKSDTPSAWARAMSRSFLMVLPKEMRSAVAPVARTCSISTTEAQSKDEPRRANRSRISGAGLAFTA